MDDMSRRKRKSYSFFEDRDSQWAKNQKIFQEGESPKFSNFPSKPCLLMSKYQKLEKSVEGNEGF